MLSKKVQNIFISNWQPMSHDAPCSVADPRRCFGTVSNKTKFLWQFLVYFDHCTSLFLQCTATVWKPTFARCL